MTSQKQVLNVGIKDVQKTYVQGCPKKSLGINLEEKCFKNSNLICNYIHFFSRSSSILSYLEKLRGFRYVAKSISFEVINV